MRKDCQDDKPVIYTSTFNSNTIIIGCKKSQSDKKDDRLDTFCFELLGVSIDQVQIRGTILSYFIFMSFGFYVVVCPKF